MLDKKALSDLITVLWNIWNSRNSKVFREVEEEPKGIWDRAALLIRDFRIFNLMEKPMIPKPVVERSWQNPEPGVVKINFDASVHDKMACYGLVARDAAVSFMVGGLVW